MRVIPSNFSPRLRFELIATGEQAGVWGQTTNATLGAYLEDAICGFAYINVAAGDYTLTVSNPGGTSEEARFAVIVVQGAPGVARTVTVPAVQKTYQVINQTAYPVTFKTAAGVGWPVAAGTTQQIACNGTDCFALGIGYSPALISTGSLAITGSLGVSGSIVAGAVPAASTGITAFSSLAAFAVDIRGRPSDSIGITRFLDYGGGTELARFQSPPGTAGLALHIGPSVLPAFSINAAAQITHHAYATFNAGANVFGGVNLSSGSLIVSAGDLFVRNAGNAGQGVIYLGNSNARYLQWDGANYNFGGSGIAYHTGNFNPGAYAALSGAGFSGAISAAGITSFGAIYATGGIGCAGNIDTPATITGGALNTPGSITASGNVSAAGVGTFNSPNGSGGGRAIVDNSNRFGSWGWNDSGFIAITVDGAGRGITTFASDERLKEDIAPTSLSALDLIRQLAFIDFRFKRLANAPADLVMPLQRGGISAQQAQTINAAWIETMPDEAGTLIPNVQLLLTNALRAIQELDAEVRTLRAAIAA